MRLTSYVKFKIEGDNISRLVRFIFKENIPCYNLVNNKNYLSGICQKRYWKYIKHHCDELSLEWEYSENTNIATFFKWLNSSKGLVVGFICGILGIILLSNTFLQLNFRNDNKYISQKIEEYILSKGYTYGYFIPSMDIFSLELNILQDVEEVSWVGIYLTGGTLNIDFVENVPKPEYNQKRLPSNLIAKNDGEIIKAEIYGGELVVPIGSGVHKGQTLVSGEVKLSDEMTVFRRSQGNIYAKVTYNEKFYCPFENECKVVNDTSEQKNFFTLYSLEISLGFKKYEGQFQTKETLNNLQFFGITLPLGIKTVDYFEYNYEKTALSLTQATTEVYKLDANYKANILKDSEIISENEQLITTDDGVTLEKEYVVIENIALEKEFLVK